MGIRGLTRFIESNSYSYLESYELHDTTLVIDGNSAACQLYTRHSPTWTSANSCFGGDYDRYARCINHFFQLLFQCKIKPVVVFDGGYESRKKKTVLERIKSKILSMERLTASNDTSVNTFPLFLKDVFEEVVKVLGVKAVRCDFEGDSSTAEIAAALNCPVLSYDSDFFIFDVQYLPFKTFELKVKNGSSYKYIPCKIYRAEKFLRANGGMDKAMLPLLAALLGNDYVKRHVFAMFFKNLKQKNDQQKRIKLVMSWLKNETKESAMGKILGRYKAGNREMIRKKIWEAVKGYTLTKGCKYLAYLDAEVSIEEVEDEDEELGETVPEEQLVHDDDMDVDQNTEEEEQSEDTDSEDVDVFEDSQHSSNLSENFLDNFRKCRFPSYFMDIAFRHQYYSVPQVEVIALESSHKISYDILSAMHTILSGGKHLWCFTRLEGTTNLGRESISWDDKFHLPTFDEIDELSLEERKDIFMKILNVDQVSTKDFLKSFPSSWHVFLMSLKYAVEKGARLSSPTVSALILSKLLLEYVDKKTMAVFNKKKSKKASSSFPGLDSINASMSSSVMKSVTQFFVNGSAGPRHDFDRLFIHSLSQFQSVLMHSMHLNRLLNCPFDDFFVSKTLNCTFVYHFTLHMRKRQDYNDCLKACPVLVETFKDIREKVQKELIGKIEIDEVPMRKRRKRKRHRHQKEENGEEDAKKSKDEEDTTAEKFQLDPNNKFSLLGMDLL